MSSHGDRRRHLPHQAPEGFPVFLTWNLKGAMPRAAIDELRRERWRLEQQPDRVGESIADRRIREGKRVFGAADRFLDTVNQGPLHLKDPRAAEVVEDSIRFGAGDRYGLFAWCVMSNHVHVPLTPREELSLITRRIKGYTAYKINGLQDARGRVFWQDESYDH